MEDVRKAAEERAARPKNAPVGAGFESERQREKNALVRQLDAQDGRNVRKIAAATAIPEEDRILRVAAYCRVSTDDIDQKLSIHLQIQQYMNQVNFTFRQTHAILMPRFHFCRFCANRSQP